MNCQKVCTTACICNLVDNFIINWQLLYESRHVIIVNLVTRSNAKEGTWGICGLSCQYNNKLSIAKVSRPVTFVTNPSNYKLSEFPPKSSPGDVYINLWQNGTWMPNESSPYSENCIKTLQFDTCLCKMSTIPNLSH